MGRSKIGNHEKLRKNQYLGTFKIVYTRCGFAGAGVKIYSTEMVIFPLLSCKKQKDYVTIAPP
jgi:hypothetical protein